MNGSKHACVRNLRVITKYNSVNLPELATHVPPDRAEYGLPVVSELMYAGIVGADMGFGKLPHPIAGGINGRCDHTLGPGTGT